MSETSNQSNFTAFGMFVAGATQIGGACIVFRDDAGDIHVSMTKIPENVATLKTLAAEFTKDAPKYNEQDLVNRLMKPAPAEETPERAQGRQLEARVSADEVTLPNVHPFVLLDWQGQVAHQVSIRASGYGEPPTVIRWRGRTFTARVGSAGREFVEALTLTLDDDDGVFAPAKHSPSLEAACETAMHAAWRNR